MPTNKKILITGSAGLVGGESVKFFCNRGFSVIGVDNDLRSYFFGEQASIKNYRKYLEENYFNYKHFEIDIRDFKKIENIFKENKFDAIIHTAAQPSHDWSQKEPLVDFDINARSTLHLLEMFRKYSKDASFIYTSTNKVYGNKVNFLDYDELETRYELKFNNAYYNGIKENFGIDQTLHSLFGVSKTSADLLVQEYGRYFNLNTAVFRCGCITGAQHQGTELHGFLSYLTKCIRDRRKYIIYGYKGKQVRDNIHAYDLVSAFCCFIEKPKIAEVYNMGGGRHSNTSIQEAIKSLEGFTGKKLKTSYVLAPRIGDHIWYISDVSKFKRHYPQWNYVYDLEKIFQDLIK